MNEPIDPIERLRAADPVPDAVSRPSDPRVETTLEEILMQTQTEAPARPRRPWLPAAVAAGVLAVAGIVGAAVLAAGDDGTEPITDDQGQVAAGDQPPGDSLAPGETDIGVSPGGDPSESSMGMCIEYSTDQLSTVDSVFSGTVTAADDTTMTFAVDEWFSAEQGPTVTLQHPDLDGMLFAPDGPSLEPGTRVLAVANEGTLWSCGYTQLYDEDVAAEWRAALGG